MEENINSLCFVYISLNFKHRLIFFQCFFFLSPNEHTQIGHLVITFFIQVLYYFAIILFYGSSFQLGCKFLEGKITCNSGPTASNSGVNALSALITHVLIGWLMYGIKYRMYRYWYMVLNIVSVEVSLCHLQANEVYRMTLRKQAKEMSTSSTYSTIIRHLGYHETF